MNVIDDLIACKIAKIRFKDLSYSDTYELGSECESAFEKIKELKIVIRDNLNHGYCPDQLRRVLGVE